MNQRTLTSVRDGIRVWLFGALLLALLTLAATALGASPTGAAPAPEPTAMTAPALTTTCWVTGDVVGDANPAVIRTSLCQSQR
jgi:hypothetical protein